MDPPRRPSYGYDQSTGKKAYWSPPYASEQNPETIKVVQPRDGNPDYSMSKAMIPSILMILFGGTNFVAFLTFAGFSLMFHAEFFVGSVVYMATGIVGVVGSLKKQRLKEVVVLLLIGGVGSLCMGISQVVLRSELLSIERYLYKSDPREAPFMIGFSIILLMISLVTIGVSIALIIIPSKLVCSCWRRDE
ncbi:uncharacterized protein LOC135485078 [Lineus longissimus]|uniref:uncharacterized protein LOC135485078 n=1 Tax=Lineus longissimus TaxID=88925 RepID=UPI002B4D9FBF